MRNAQLTGTDKAGKAQRATFSRLLQASREEARLIAGLSVKLRFVNQSRTDSVAAARARARTPLGPRPWDSEGLDS
jgi:hypothetical protein